MQLPEPNGSFTAEPSTKDISGGETVPRRVVLLGSTGSIGTQAIAVADAAPERFQIVALAAGGNNLDLLAEQAVHTRAAAVGCAAVDLAALRHAISKASTSAGVTGYDPELFVGAGAATAVAAWPEAEVVLNGITGSVGLGPTLAALRAGSTLALAGSALATAVVIALAVVAAATLAPSPVLRRTLANLPPLFSAVPVFWLGLVLLELLSIRLGVLSLFPDGSFLSLAVPVLVLASSGSDDRLREWARETAELLPEGSFQLLEGSWHGLDDESLASAVDAFLD